MSFRFLNVFTIVASIGGLLFDGHAHAETSPHPNIVWILSEDNSVHYLKHFDPHGVATPMIESMAREGITFDHAFSNAPVCSVARTTLITGCYAPRIGTQYHRRMKMVGLPPDVVMFPSLLKQNGYHTSNNAKEDYNALSRISPWDESGNDAHWIHRKENQPFFHVRTFTQSHESSLHLSESKLSDTGPIDSESVHLPEYLPNTPLFRNTAAMVQKKMLAIDKNVGKVLTELKSTGELENTFVFYFGDHGGVLPRSKGYLYESGLHVPLVIRVPKNYQDRVDRPLGSRATGFVSFVDFGPTVLNLAGISGEAVDKYLQSIDGKAFLGKDVKTVDVDDRDTAHGYADRMDEKYDLVRSLRKSNWKYIRNFESFAPDSLFNTYRMKMLAYQQWQKMHDEGQLTPVQDAFFQTRSPEALYDLNDDPDETRNLAQDPAHKARLLSMRNELTEFLKVTHDTSFIPEFILIEDPTQSPSVMSRRMAGEIDRYIDIAQFATRSLDNAMPDLIGALNSGDFLERYWALVAVASLASASPADQKSLREDEAITNLIRRLTVDPEPAVAARAATLTAILGTGDPRPGLMRSLSRAVSEAEALQIANLVEFVNSMPNNPFPIDSREVGFLFKPQPQGELQLRINRFQSSTETN